MSNSDSSKWKYSWQWWLKISISLLFGYLLYRQLTHQRQWDDIVESLRSAFNNTHWYIVVFLFALLPINWLLESIKWKALANQAFALSFKSAFKAVLTGVFFSMFTPNRMGQFGGRLWHVPRRHALQSIYATIVGSFAQNIAHFAAGMVGLGYLLYKDLFTSFKPWLFLIVLVATCGSLWLYFNINRLVRYVKEIPWVWLSKRLKAFTWSFDVSPQVLLYTLILSSLRLCIYSLQYYLLVRAVGIEVSLSVGGACIATIFLIQTFIPLPPVIGFLARGEVAIQVWGMVGADELLILYATYTLWLINIVLPATSGWLFFLITNYRTQPSSTAREDVSSLS